MKNQAGYTLLSMMLALSVFLIIVSLAVNVTAFMNQRFQPQWDTQKETRLFFIQTATELHFSHQVSCSTDHRMLTMKKGTDYVSYAFMTNGRIIRQVNRMGYEIVLQQVKSATFQSDGEFISIRVTDKANRHYYWDDRLYVKDDAGD
ncbi:prepilin-type N-terminal cleavage/methylation domain-containing protein [Sporolactobacillus shoreicorticis]|uniref:Competence type IV pilus minor pilin ComGF n=1 Tax=Sporolactobacillus shoreicorticis TaxID=1923877 RepID=A0ABW5S7Z0_9BACL|nr:competence type IV pilus minor pilin ComGF [Sporolactobacillus shoreicorticis]MCO7126833.1 prepilin-type N-terminal cleavage/methylation domain-containing protein [Sporolactobacillus shoreicorticis]